MPFNRCFDEITVFGFGNLGTNLFTDTETTSRDTAGCRDSVLAIVRLKSFGTGFVFVDENFDRILFPRIARFRADL